MMASGHVCLSQTYTWPCSAVHTECSYMPNVIHTSAHCLVVSFHPTLENLSGLICVALINCHLLLIMGEALSLTAL